MYSNSLISSTFKLYNWSIRLLCVSRSIKEKRTKKRLSYKYMLHPKFWMGYLSPSKEMDMDLELHCHWLPPHTMIFVPFKVMLLIRNREARERSQRWLVVHFDHDCLKTRCHRLKCPRNYDKCFLAFGLHNSIKSVSPLFNSQRLKLARFELKPPKPLPLEYGKSTKETNSCEALINGNSLMS